MKEQYLTILSGIVPVLLILGLGMLSRRLNWLSETSARELIRISVRLFVPCLIFRFVINNPALSEPEVYLRAPLFGFTTICLGIALAWLAAPLLGLGENQKRRTFAVSCGIFNYGYMALPITQMLFDEATVGVLVLFMVGVDLALWTAGVMTLSGSFHARSLVRLINPPVVAFLIATAINLGGYADSVPYIIEDTYSRLATCAIPFGIFLSGVTLAEGLSKSTGALVDRAALGGVLLRMLLIPAAMLGLGLVLPLETELLKVLAVQVAMPSGIFTIVLASHYNGSLEVAVRVLLATTVISLLSTPLALSVALRVLGLD